MAGGQMGGLHSLGQGLISKATKLHTHIWSIRVKFLWSPRSYTSDPQKWRFLARNSGQHRKPTFIWVTQVQGWVLGEDHTSSRSPHDTLRPAGLPLLCASISPRAHLQHRVYILPCGWVFWFACLFVCFYGLPPPLVEIMVCDGFVDAHGLHLAQWLSYIRHLNEHMNERINRPYGGVPATLTVECAVELTENQRRNSLLHQKEILNEILCLIHLEFIFPQR